MSRALSLTAEQRERISPRFLSHVERDESTGCLLWTGAKGSNGYGIATGPNRRNVLAHRLSHAIFVGPIPTGFQVDHLCKVVACVEPAHLEAVPHHVNNQRSDSPSAINARKTECVNGHEFTPDNTLTWKGHRACRACQRERYQSLGTFRCPGCNRDLKAHHRKRHLALCLPATTEEPS